MATKRKGSSSGSADEQQIDPSDELLFHCLGGGNEVGRSCHIIQYKGKTVMLDAGMHPAKDGFAALPFFDDFDLSTVDILLISQYVPLLYVRVVSATTSLVSHAQMDIQTDIQTFFSLPFLHVQTCTMRYSMQFKFLLASTLWCLPSYPNVFVLYSFVNSMPFAHISTTLNEIRQLIDGSFHLDHSGSLPYVLSKTNFKGRVFMTHATKAIYKWLIQDNVRVSNTSSSSDQRTSLYNEHDHLSTLPIIETIDFNTTHTINSIRITPFPAGHVLGAAMFLISIAGLNILFTGDYSREEDRHLISAEVPKGVKIDVMITESTFGISSNPPRLEREAALMKSVTSIINRGGRVLMPVFALGRAQELLLILDEYWSRHPELQKVPIYYIGNMARRCMVVYQTYIGAMNENIKRLFRQRMAEAEARGDKSVTAGPWDFRFVRSLRNLDRFEDVGGCVMLASPGMLQTGTSRELLERWAPNERNGVIMTGYSVEGTMGKQIINEPEQIPAVMSAKNAAGPSDDQKIMIQRRCTVDEISFAAHVDGVENREFIESVAAPVVILVHGEKHQMMRLKSKLLSLNVDKEVKVKVYTPANCDEVRIPFMVDKVARVVGRLAETSPPIGQDDSRLMDGVLVQNGFKLSMMASDDLREYAGLTTTMVTCKQYITLSTASIDLIRWALESTFGLIEEINSPSSEAVKGSNGDSSETQNDSVIKKGEEADEEIPSRELTTYLIMGCVFVKYNPQRREVEVEWEGNMMNDGVADAVMAVLLTVESSPAAVKRSSKNKHCHNHDAPLPNNPHSQLTPDERFMRLCMILEAQFGSEIAPIERPKLKYHGGRKERSPSAAEDPNKVDTPNIDEPEDEEELRDMEELELARLQSLGIPVPGIEIKVDNHIARVWLETLEVECSYPVLRDRVRVVVERAVETVADMWNTRAGSAMPVKGIPNGSNTIKTEQVV